MTRIYYDENSLVRAVNVRIDNSIYYLRKSIETSNMLNVPYDFKYRNYLKKLDDNLKINLNCINDVYNNVKKSSKDFSNVNNQLSNEISNIDNYSISLRQSAIK